MAEMAGNCLKWFEMAVNGWNGCKWLEWLEWLKMAGSGLKSLGMAENG